jgi:hypothetical protein
MSLFFEREPTQKVLLEYLADTERVFTGMLRTLDKEGGCRLTPSLDLGFPHEVIRLAGGFPTGVLVGWNCKVPIVPIDTTVNVCTSSLFELSDDISASFDSELFEALSKQLDRSSYRQNFQRGNHFIALAKSAKSGRFTLILHSSAAEFKKDFNGLYPVPGNWYSEDVEVYVDGPRYIRYISGRKAEVFYRVASQIESFNEVRHEFVAETIVGDLCLVEAARHRHHYYMPTNQSVMIGSFLAQPGEILPIFTCPGLPIFLYRLDDDPPKRVDLEGAGGYLVPHGWGKFSKKEPVIQVSHEQQVMLVNGYEFPINQSASLRDHPDLSLRCHDIGEGPESYFESIQPYCPGKVVDRLEQVASFSKYGYQRWRP